MLFFKSRQEKLEEKLSYITNQLYFTPRREEGEERTQLFPVLRAMADREDGENRFVLLSVIADFVDVKKRHDADVVQGLLGQAHNYINGVLPARDRTKICAANLLYKGDVATEVEELKALQVAERIYATKNNDPLTICMMRLAFCRYSADSLRMLQVLSDSREMKADNFIRYAMSAVLRMDDEGRKTVVTMGEELAKHNVITSSELALLIKQSLMLARTDIDLNFFEYRLQKIPDSEDAQLALCCRKASRFLRDGDHQNALRCYEQALYLNSVSLSPLAPDIQGSFEKIVKLLKQIDNG